MKNLNYIVAALCAIILAGVAFAANNNGENQSFVVRRPQPNQEFVKFATTNLQVAPLVWTSSLNRISGRIIVARTAAGALVDLLGDSTRVTNVISSAVTGNVLYVNSSIVWQTNMNVETLLTE